MELFDTNQYTTGTAYDFELNSSEKKQGKQPIYDPAWEDGSAFPGIEDEAEKWKEGSRLINPSGTGGVIQKASRKKYTILWDNGHAADYTAEAIKAYGYQKVKSDCSDKQSNSYEDSSSKPGSSYEDSSEKLGSSYEDSSGNLGDRWNPEHFDSNPSFKADGRQLTIFLEESGTEPPEPDDFKTIAEYEEAWEQWQNNSLHISTYAVGSALGSPLLESSSEGSNLLDSRKRTSTAQTSLASGSQKFPTLGTSESLPWKEPSNSTQSMSSQLRHHANHSAYKGNEEEPMTSATASPQSSESLSNTVQNSSPLKTLKACSVASIDQTTKKLSHTLVSFSGSFPTAGMMSSGELFPVEPLERPSLENGFSWLESPTALSSIGRSPGLTKLEGSLMKQGVLERGQVINPDFLEESFGIPPGWTNPSECRPATELLENDEQPSAMRLIQEWERSPLEESNTYIQLPPSEPELIPEIFSEETKKDRRRGCLYKYLENKKLKSGAIASYPRVTGERDPDNPKHWRWGFNWEEKIDGQWRNRSFGCVPVGTIPMIQSMQKSDVSLQEIIDFIRRSKRKVQ